MSNTNELLDAEFDNLFKAVISAGWNVKSDGHVESPMGHFAIVEIPVHFVELNDMADAVDPGNEYPWETVPTGWYFTVENSDGFIFVYKCRDEADAITRFVKAADAYAKWEAE